MSSSGGVKPPRGINYINYIEQNGYQSNTGFQIKQGDLCRPKIVYTIQQKIGKIQISLQRSGGGQLVSSGLMDPKIGTWSLEQWQWEVNYPAGTYDLTAKLADANGTTISVYQAQHIVIAGAPAGRGGTPPPAGTTPDPLAKYNILGRDIIPKINNLLGLNYSGGVVFKLQEQEMNYPASTTGNIITVNPKWFKEHPNDEGAIVHELVHVVMRCPKMDESNKWMIEGIADYVRNKLGYSTTWSSPHKGDPKAGYQETAHFLSFLEGKFGLEYIKKLAFNLSNKGNLLDDLIQKIQEYLPPSEKT